MSHSAAVGFHIAIGALGIVLYWGALLAGKGSPRHRAFGKAFFATLMVVALSVGPLLFLQPGDFDPAYVVQFAYLTLCLLTVAMVGWTAIRWKHDLERFRARHFKVLGAAMFALAIVVLAGGIANRDAIPMVFSIIGIVYGGAMLRFAWFRCEVQPRWWMGWHLNAVSGLFNAVHGTFLFVAWRTLFDPAAADGTTIVFQLGTMAAALGMRLWFGRQRNAPLRFAKEHDLANQRRRGVQAAA